MEVAGRKGDGLRKEETAFSGLPEPRSNAGPEDLISGISERRDSLCRGVASTTVQEGMMIPAMEPLVQAAVRGGPAEAGRSGISGYHTGGSGMRRHAVRTHRTVQRPF